MGVFSEEENPWNGGQFESDFQAREYFIVGSDLPGIYIYIYIYNIHICIYIYIYIYKYIYNSLAKEDTCMYVY